MTRNVNMKEVRRVCDSVDGIKPPSQAKNPDPSKTYTKFARSRNFDTESEKNQPFGLLDHDKIHL